MEQEKHFIEEQLNLPNMDILCDQLKELQDTNRMQKDKIKELENDIQTLIENTYDDVQQWVLFYSVKSWLVAFDDFFLQGLVEELRVLLRDVVGEG